MTDTAEGEVQASSSRELIAFAFVEEAYSKTGDIVAGLLPLFSPILAKRTGRRFDPVEFSRDVEARYDIPMRPIVAEGLVERLAEAGMLRAEPDAPRTYRIVAKPWDAKSMGDGDFDELFSNFNAFASKSLSRLGLDTTEEVLQSALLKRLTTAHFLAFIDKREKNYYKGDTLSLKKNQDDEQEEIYLDQALDVLCAEFVLEKLEAGGAIADLLTRLTTGALIAEVVLTLQTPSSSDLLHKLAVVFDGPLLLDYLDLSSPELKDYANDLFELVNKAQIQKFVFKHSIAEMKGTLQGPLSALARGEEPYGPLGSRIRLDSSHAAYARAVLDGLEGRLEAIGVGIVDADEFANAETISYCDDTLEEGLRNHIGTVMFNLERRIRDARSIATILRLRKERQKTATIADSGWILATRNDAVAERSQSYLEFKRVITREQVPPAITDRRLAGYLWFAVGGSVGSLSKKKLVANCSYVMTPRTDVVSKVRQYLRDLDKEKAEIFVALMRDQRAQRCLMRSTMGFTSAIRLDNVEELLEEVRLSTASEVIAESRAKEVALKADHEKQVAAMLKDHHINSLEQEAEVLKLQNTLGQASQTAVKEIKRRDEQIESFSGRLDDLERERLRDIDQRVQRAVGSANSSIRTLKIMMTLGYSVIVGCTYWLAPSEHTLWALVAAVLVGLLAYGFVHEFIFKKLAVPIWTTIFTRRCTELGVIECLSEYTVDAIERVARRRTDELILDCQDET